MAFYIITGKLRSGKSLVATSRMKQRLLSGARVATNFDLNVEHLLPVTVQKIDLTRLPDLPAVEDLQALGQGSTEYAEESKFGLIVLDEGSGNFNARDWADKSRQAMLDWLKHSGKLRWDVYIIVQSINTIDKQIRDSFAENLVTCKRVDKLAIPFISSFTSLLGLNIKMPKIHVGIVRYGLDARAPIVDRWIYRGIDLYKAYNTEQVFDKNTSPALYCYLSPFAVKGHLMNKFQIAKSIAASYVISAFILGVIVSWLSAWWIYKGSQNKLLINGSSTVQAFKIQDVDQSVSIDGLAFVDSLVYAYLSDGRVIRTTQFVRDETGIRVKVGEKWIYKKN